MQNLNKYLSLALLPLALAGCGKDKNLEEYQRDKLQQNLGLYKSVEGTYSGIVRSKEDNHVIGAMQISLTAQTRNKPSNDGQLSIGSPTLVGNVQFLDKDIINVVAPDGFYDPNTGLYNSEIEITRTGGGATNGGGIGSTPNNGGGYNNAPVAPGQGGDKEKIIITGRLGNGNLTGDMQTQNYPDSGGRFELVRNGGTVRDLLKGARPGDRRREDSDVDKVTSYTGLTRFTDLNGSGDSRPRPVRVTLTRQTYNTAEDILDLISPVRVVQASINYSDSLRLLFPKAIFDTRQGYLTAQTLLTLNGQLNQMTINCREQDDKSLYCSHLTSAGGEAAITEVTMDKGRTRDPIDDNKDLQTVTKTFIGKGYFTPNDQRKMKLQVTFPARSRRDELLELFFPITERSVQASLVFSEFISASFPSVKWDMNSGLLDGSVERTGSGSYIQQIQCTNFFFTKSKEPFTCTYYSSRSSSIVINFKYPYKG